MSPLFHLVGQDAGVCIEFSHLNERVSEAEKSVFFQRLQKSSFYHSWKKGKPWQKFQKRLEQIEKETGKTTEELATQLFGQSALIAIYPSSEGEPKGLLLSKVQNDKRLQEIITSWNKTHPSKIKKRTYAGSDYYMKVNIRKKRPGKEKLYYIQKKHLFALSDHEEMIRKVIDFSNAKHSPKNIKTPKKSKKTLANSADFQKMYASLSENSAIRLFVNPRAWDSKMKLGKNLNKQEQMIADFWKKCRSISIGLQMKEGVVVEGVLLWNQSGLSDPSSQQWFQFLKATSEQTSMLNRIPASAIVVACGRFDGMVFKQIYESITTEKERNQLKPQYAMAQSLLLELDPFDDLLANLGTNWGAWVQPAKEQNAERFLVDALFVTNLNNPRSTSKHKKDIPNALENLAITGLNGLTVIYNTQLKKNTKRATLHRKKEGEAIIRWVETSTFYQVAVGISPKLLLISNSPRLIEQFVTSTKIKKHSLLIDSKRFKKWSAEYFKESRELFYVDVVALRQLIKSKEAFIKERLKKKKGTTPSDIDKRFAQMQEALMTADVLFLAIHYLEDGVQIKIGAVAE